MHAWQQQRASRIKSAGEEYKAIQPRFRAGQGVHNEGPAGSAGLAGLAGGVVRANVIVQTGSVTAIGGQGSRKVYIL